MNKPPQIDNAPGLAWRPLKHGWQARWRARADLIERGFEPKTVRLWASTKEEPEPTPGAILYIQDTCNRLQTEMLVFGRGGVPVDVSYDGTLRTLICAYQNDPDSPYKKVRHASRIYYDSLCRRIEADHGDERVEAIKARLVLRWHELWTTSKDGQPNTHIALAHSLVGMLRTLVNFGAGFLEDGNCERLSAMLHRQKFKQAKARNERLVASQVVAIRAKARELGKRSMALAQAIQFDLMLRQKDVIGEWVPLSEPGLSAVTDGNRKWLRGLRWEEVDQTMTLRHVTSKRQKEIEVNLLYAPMVLVELGTTDRTQLPASGPMIICEATGKPWAADMFRKTWRDLADKCGIPKSVRNMDSRAGAITEATEAGAPLESIKHAATHSDIGMTQRYARGASEKTAEVMRQRAEYRNKSGTK